MSCSTEFGRLSVSSSRWVPILSSVYCCSEMSSVSCSSFAVRYSSSFAPVSCKGSCSLAWSVCISNCCSFVSVGSGPTTGFSSSLIFIFSDCCIFIYSFEALSNSPPLISLQLMDRLATKIWSLMMIPWAHSSLDGLNECLRIVFMNVSEPISLQRSIVSIRPHGILRLSRRLTPSVSIDYKRCPIQPPQNTRTD